MPCTSSLVDARTIQCALKCDCENKSQKGRNINEKVQPNHGQRLLKVTMDAIEDDIASKRLKSSIKIASTSENSNMNNVKLLNELLPPRQVVTESNIRADEFSELMAELDKLHSMIDVSKMLKRIKELNAKLTNAKSDNEKHFIFMTFNPNGSK